jgi:hypothetical protein
MGMVMVTDMDMGRKTPLRYTEETTTTPMRMRMPTTTRSRRTTVRRKLTKIIDETLQLKFKALILD